MTARAELAERALRCLLEERSIRDEIRSAEIDLAFLSAIRARGDANDREREAIVREAMALPAETLRFYVKHRTYQETSGSGHTPPQNPWKYDGPFATFDEANAHWQRILPNWQVGCVVTKCEECGSYVAVEKAR